jgi:hypothetical protein
VFTKDEATKKQCRVIPMLVLPGQIQGQISVTAPNCAADLCMHWRWLEEPSSLDPTKGRGGCALDDDIAFKARGKD